MFQQIIDAALGVHEQHVRQVAVEAVPN